MTKTPDLVGLDDVTVDLLGSEFQRVDRAQARHDQDAYAWRDTWLILSLRLLKTFHQRLGLPAMGSAGWVSVVSRDVNGVPLEALPSTALPHGSAPEPSPSDTTER